MEQYNKHRPETIQTMFGSIANSYDRANGILSFQLHRLWNQKLRRETYREKIAKRSFCIADLCCGTGAISLPWLAAQKHPQQAFLIDFCQEMLNQAKENANLANLNIKHELQFINADVQAIPLLANSIDFATMAYGIRNVASPQQCFGEVFRILKPGGAFGILELTEPKNSLLRLGHTLYLKTVLPLLGKLLAKNGDAYRYLSQSIQNFVEPSKLMCLLQQSGFSKVKILPLTGGIATLLIAYKE